MQNNRFVVLTGHLNDYPLSDLVGILRHQRKTGRLLIEYQKGPAQLFFYDGDLVDAQFNDLIGLQAVCFAIAQPPASFNFNPLIQPQRRSIESSFQRTVSELFGCWDDSAVQIEANAVDTTPLITSSPTVDALNSHQLKGREVEPLALLPMAQPRWSRKHVTSILVMAAAGLMMLGLSTVIAVTGGFRTKANNAVPIAANPPTTKIATLNTAEGQPGAKSTSEGAASKSREQAGRFSNKESKNKSAASSSPNPSSETPDTSTQAVTVVMQIENGRVLKASIANPRPGMDSYEALALRIARQRRFPSQQNGRETVRISVANPSSEPNK